MLWDGVEVTAVDYNPDVLEVYSHYNPHDTVVCGDAHQYLLDHYDEFDFIWASPPCPTHSKMMKFTKHDLRKYPDMSLYQEVLWLTHFFNGEWVIENVRPYYEPLIKPQSIGSRVFWSNKIIHAAEVASHRGFIDTNSSKDVALLQDWLGIHWDKPIYLGDHDPNKAYRNAVHPRLGLEVFLSATRKEGLFV